MFIYPTPNLYIAPTYRNTSENYHLNHSKDENCLAYTLALTICCPCLWKKEERVQGASRLQRWGPGAATGSGGTPADVNGLCTRLQAPVLGILMFACTHTHRLSWCNSAVTINSFSSFSWPSAILTHLFQNCAANSAQLSKIKDLSWS